MRQVPGKPATQNPDFIIQPPHVPDALADFLEKHYKEQGWRPDRQDEWQHHRRNGMVELAQYLIDCNKAQKADLGLDPGATPVSQS